MRTMSAPEGALFLVCAAEKAGEISERKTSKKNPYPTEFFFFKTGIRNIGKTLVTPTTY